MIKIIPRDGSCDTVDIYIRILPFDGQNPGPSKAFPIESNGVEIPSVLGSKKGDEIDQVMSDIDSLRGIDNNVRDRSWSNILEGPIAWCRERY